MKLDEEGTELVKAAACARLLHGFDGDPVHRLQAHLSRACVAYAVRTGVNVKIVEAAIDREAELMTRG